MVEFENSDVLEIRVLKEDFHTWLETKIPDLNPGDDIVSFETDPQDRRKYLVRVIKGT